MNYGIHLKYMFYVPFLKYLKSILISGLQIKKITSAHITAIIERMKERKNF